MPAMRPLKNPTLVTSICSLTVPQVYPSPSIYRLRLDLTRMIRFPPVKSARSASQLILSKTWKACSIISRSMTINATASILLCLYLAVARKQRVPFEKVRGTLQNDILKEYIARGTYIYPPAPSLRLVTDIFAFCAREVPNWNTISISGYHIREAGSTAVQEVAFTLANGITYVEAALRAGLQIDEFAPRLSFFFNSHNNLLEEISKFRAARRLGARIMRDRSRRA